MGRPVEVEREFPYGLRFAVAYFALMLVGEREPQKVPAVWGGLPRLE